MEDNYVVHELEKQYRRWAYKNTTFLVLSLIVFFYFADSDAVQSVIHSIGKLHYLGIFITGIFFVSTFTIAPAAVVLYRFAEQFSIWEVALLAGLGGVLGDYIIFRFLRNNLFEELTPLYKKVGGSRVKKLFKTRYFAWLLPLVGAALIASPLPDEAGIGLLGISKLKTWQFLLIALTLDILGIALLIVLARVT